jgi:hypothetical protein
MCALKPGASTCDISDPAVPGLVLRVAISGSKAWLWYAALKRAGIENFRWHDLRHTWASWHVQQGTPLHALQELGGWETAEMVRRYAHFSAEHLAPYADRLCGVGATVSAHGTNLSQPEKSDVAA